LQCDAIDGASGGSVFKMIVNDLLAFGFGPISERVTLRVFGQTLGEPIAATGARDMENVLATPLIAIHL
jgi:hypothetical protein